MTLDRTSSSARLLELLASCSRSASAAAPGTASAGRPQAGCAPVRPPARSTPSPCRPSSSSTSPTDAGINFVHDNGAFGDKLLPETMGSGVAFLDYDGDGDQDLFFVNSSYWPGHEVKPRADPGALPQRRQGTLRRRHQGSRARQVVLRPGRGRGRLRQRRRPRPLRHGDRPAAICFATTARATSTMSPQRPVPEGPTAG